MKKYCHLCYELGTVGEEYDNSVVFYCCEECMNSHSWTNEETGRVVSGI